MIDRDCMDHYDIACIVEVLLDRLDIVRELGHLDQHAPVLRALSALLLLADGWRIEPGLKERYLDHNEWAKENERRERYERGSPI